MKAISQLFFALLRVAIGTQNRLSRMPSEREWDELYGMAEKQSLVGVCFAGVQRLMAGVQGDCGGLGMNGMLYLKWMGMAAKIQQRNELMDRHCAEIQEMLSRDGLRSAILKGQGVGALYPQGLNGLRQPGDIDVWVDAPMDEVLVWAARVGISEEASYLHVGARCFDDTDVELHYRPAYLRSMIHDRRLQKFCDGHRQDWTWRNGIMVPAPGFDVVYQLSHIYRHMFGMGIGLRQLMDYFFVLRAAADTAAGNDGGAGTIVIRTLKHLGLYRFAGAVMYVMREVFGLEERCMVCPVDERRGRRLLDRIMRTGNFGLMDERQLAARKTAVGSFRYKLGSFLELVWLYPDEVLWAPVWKLCRMFG